MNRFKFRVWDGHKIWFTENLWSALTDFGFAYIGANIINKGKPWEFDDKNIVIQQFTGLLDKNGKEIYEGDIVIKMGQKFTVVYDAPGFILKPIGGITTYQGKYYWEGVEIINNIFENPELLQKSEKS